ncbi:MAG: hypothetical protein H6655_12615 [Ardenticatenaceae bacterium]|nr:hypothetical protein [Ardenticatenaceae bacterium]
MDAFTSKSLLDLAIAHPYDGTQDIEPYQYQEGLVTVTLFVTVEKEGRLSLTVQNLQAASHFARILSLLALPKCQFVEKIERKGYLIHRYQFDLPNEPEEKVEETAVIQPPSPLKMKRHQQVAWREIDDNRCHICHRELTDPLSLKVKIGSVCRKNIEKAEGFDSSKWEDILQDELEELWTNHNTYEKRRQKKAEAESQERRKLIELMASRAKPRFHMSRTVNPVKKVESSHKKTPPVEARFSSSSITLPVAECIYCGKMTTNYWYYDGKTKTCKCRNCGTVNR